MAYLSAEAWCTVPQWRCWCTPCMCGFWWLQEPGCIVVGGVHVQLGGLCCWCSWCWCSCSTIGQQARQCWVPVVDLGKQQAFAKIRCQLFFVRWSCWSMHSRGFVCSCTTGALLWINPCNWCITGCNGCVHIWSHDAFECGCSHLKEAPGVPVAFNVMQTPPLPWYCHAVHHHFAFRLGRSGAQMPASQ